MAVAWAVGCWANNSWLGINAGPPNAWRGATTPVISKLPSTDGDERKRRRLHKEARERLRQQIVAAIDGPISPHEIEPVIDAYVEASPKSFRVPDVAPLKISLERLNLALADARRQIAQQEEEAVVMLLN